MEDGRVDTTSSVSLRQNVSATLDPGGNRDDQLSEPLKRQIQSSGREQVDPKATLGAIEVASRAVIRSAWKLFNGPQDPSVGVPTANNFLKGVSFSPDGTCLLSSSDDTVLRVFEVPDHALKGPAFSDSDEACEAVKHDNWSPCLNSVEGETIYDFAWYPRMSSAEPATSVFVSTSRDHPLHMWDAFTGNLRATYRAYDHLDEVAAANSVCFNTQGDKIFAGYNRMVRVFDVAQPGRSFETRPTCKTRKSKSGQRGIVSALAFSPDSAGGGLYAAGSYAKSVCLYSENSRGRAVAELAIPSEGVGGVTHLKFAPAGRLLFSGSRKDDKIVCWDIRQPKEVFHTFRRHVNTNQRISFDVDPSGRYLATGSTERRALVYDIETQALAGSLENQTDAVGAVCFHPYAALLGVCTGQRHFDLDTSDVSDSDDSMDADMFGHDARDSRHEAQRQNVVAIHSLRQPGLEGGC